jgi:hypothetical protein
LQILGLIIGFVGGIMLTLTEVKKSKQIEQEAASCVDYNPLVKKSIEEKSTLAIVSAALIAIGFLLQLVGFGIS